LFFSSMFFPFGLHGLVLFIAILPDWRCCVHLNGFITVSVKVETSGQPRQDLVV